MHSPTNRMVDASRFAMVPRNDVPRSAFDMQHTHKTTFDAGRLVPVYVEEVLPGDSFRVKMTALCRLATPIVPIMDNLTLDSFFFFVPNRLVWSNWERFMGEQNGPADTTSFLTPYVELAVTDYTVGSIYDYMGVPTIGGGANRIRVQAMPYRAYNLIFNEWFRHQDLEALATVPTGDGPDAPTTFVLRLRNKRHDYFTSSMPWPQKPINQTGFTSFDPLQPGQGMSLPFAGAPITGIGIASGVVATAAPVTMQTSGARDVTFNPYFPSTNFAMRADAVSGYPDARVMINDIRTALSVQVLLERNARGGTRYAELVRSHFGVVSPDARLQRPEFLGGGRTMVSINPVAQTSASGGGSVLGQLAGVGTALASNHGFTQSFTEHGFIIGIVSVRMDQMYQQGLERFWSRRTPYDFYWPSLAHLGEQAVLSREIFADGSAADTNVWGYQERWAEYKYRPSRASGFMRSTNATPLDMWHLGIEYAARPVLNESFMWENAAPLDRALQVATQQGEQMLLDAFFDVRAVRPIPMFSIPGVGPTL